MTLDQMREIMEKAKEVTLSNFVEKIYLQSVCDNMMHNNFEKLLRVAEAAKKTCYSQSDPADPEPFVWMALENALKELEL